MTTASQHTGLQAAPDSTGLAPRGMAWVAWRQRRSLILLTLALYAAAYGALIVVRLLQARQFAASGLTDLAACRDPAMNSAILASCERWIDVRDSWSSTTGVIGQLGGAVCLLFGLGLGSVVVGHELEHNRAAFAFSQSVSPSRWAAAMSAVVIVPTVLIVAMLSAATGAVIARLDRAEDSTVSTSGVLSHGSIAVMMFGFICLAFALSTVIGTASGGFWGGLGFLVVGGIVLGSLGAGSSGTSSSQSITCTGDDLGRCSRLLNVLSRYQSLGNNGRDIPTFSTTWVLIFLALGVVSLLAGFLLLRLRFR